MPAVAITFPIYFIVLILYFVIKFKYWIWTIPPTIIYTAIIYVSSKHINYWWFKRFPPILDKEMGELMMRFFPYYRNLIPEEKLRFGQQFTLFNMETAYITKELPFVPPDVMTLISAAAMRVTFGLKEYMLPDFEMVVLYRQAFHTPKIKRFHTGEVHQEDGCVIFAIDPILAGINRPQDHYDMAIHQWAIATAFQTGIKASDFYLFDDPEGDGHIGLLRHLAKIRGWSDRLETLYLPFEQEEIFGICTEHFFHAPTRFQEILPKMYEAMKKVLNQDPMKKDDPVIDRALITN